MVKVPCFPLNSVVIVLHSSDWLHIYPIECKLRLFFFFFFLLSRQRKAPQTNSHFRIVNDSRCARPGYGTILNYCEREEFLEQELEREGEKAQAVLIPNCTHTHSLCSTLRSGRAAMFKLWRHLHVPGFSLKSRSRPLWRQPVNNWHGFLGGAAVFCTPDSF